MNMKSNFHTLSFLRIHFGVFIVSPFNDELIEIRFGFFPLPHDLKSNQIEVKRILRSFALFPSLFIAPGVKEIERGKQIEVNWIPELENCEKVIVRKLKHVIVT